MKSLMPIVLLGLGVLMLVFSFLWPVLFPASRSWTKEKSEQMTKLQDEAHKLLFLVDRAKTKPTPGGPSPQEAQAKFDKTKAELDALRAEFESVRDTPKNTGTYLRWIGTTFALLGGIAVMIARGG